MILFILLILALVAVDLFLMKKRGDREMTFGESLTATLIWIALALLFNLAIYWIYGGSKEAALLFFTGYLIEKSLSLDNVFIIALIFSYFKVPTYLQHRVLFWGVLGAIFMRLFMILLGSALIAHFSFMNILFGLFLVATAVKMLFIDHQEIHPENNPLVKFAKRFFPVTHTFHGSSFFIRIENIWYITPLFLALIVIETADLIFAIDSIPAIFAITTDPFIIFTSNIFAILGLRSLYFVLATAINHFYYLRYSLIFILGFVGVKLLLAHDYPIEATTSLLIILSALFLGIVPTLFAKEEQLASYFIPIFEQFKHFMVVTAKDLKRISILIGGILILLVGLALLVLPGPGLLFIFLGLSLLAKEFHWVKKFLNKIRSLLPKQ